jgi:hypothetical protein
MTTERTEKLEAEFVSLVQQSWKTHQFYFWNNSVDEVLIGAIVNAGLEKGYLLTDAVSEQPYSYRYSSTSSESDPTAGRFSQPINSHFLRFEDPKDKSRLIYQLDRITTKLSDAKVLGQLARVTIGFGQKAKDMNHVFQAMKEEFKSSFVDVNEPGIITFESDESAGYIYAKVTIIINIADYNKENKIANIDYEKLNYHIESVVHSLKKYLKGRNLI